MDPITQQQNQSLQNLVSSGQAYNAQGQLIKTPPTPTPTTAPTPTTIAPSSQPATQTPTQSATPNPFVLAQVMTGLENQYKTSNSLMTQRNLVLKALYDQPLTDQEKSQLDPSLLQAVNSGDRSQIDMNLRLISDQVAGRSQTLDQSVQYLTQAYNQQVQQAETNRQNAIDTVLNYSKSLGQKPSIIMNALYPQLGAQLGAQLDNLAAPLLSSTQVQSTTPLLGAQVGTIDGLASYNTAYINPGVNRPTRNNNPGDIKLSDWSKNLPGVVGVESTSATDGGNFLIFDSAQSGMNAISQLLQQGKAYQGVSADQAIKSYSGGAYGASAVGLNPTQNFQQQISDPSMLQSVVSAIAQREGFTAQTGASGTGLTQDAIDLAAQQYLTTGQMPSLGLGSSPQTRAARSAILNRAAELADGSVPGINKAQLSALTSSLTQQTQYANTMERSVNTVDANIKLLQEAAGYVNQSSVPIANQITNSIKLSTGDGALNAFNTALQTVRTEYANILARGGQVTDSQRGESAKLLPDNITLDQLNQVIGILQSEGQNVIQGATSQVDSIQNQMTNLLGGGATNTTGASSATDTQGITQEVQSIMQNKSAYTFKTREDIINALVQQGVSQDTASSIVYKVIPDNTPNW